MKLKQLPDDFRVEEMNDFEILPKGDYRLYSVEKKGIDSFYVLNYLSKTNKIPISEFGIAGLKDKHAITKQYFTIPSKYSIAAKDEKNLRVIFLGFVSKGLKLGDLKGNRFEITVRDLKKGEIDGPLQKAMTISEIGMPNYFDSQRFGSVIDKDFIAKHLIKREYEKAVKIFLTKYTRFEGRAAKEEKRKILESWGSFSGIKSGSRTFAAIMDEYTRTKDWLKAYKKIPANLRELYISAYQSYLWNKCIKELLRKTANSKYLYTIEYNIGSLLYYKKLSREEMEKLPKTFQTISDRIKPALLEKPIIEKVLSKEGIVAGDFDIKKATENFFKTSERDVLLKPYNLRISKPIVDELNGRPGSRFKMIVSFELPKGSYATVVTKRLFNK